MDIKNQYIALGLMATKRIIVFPDTGMVCKSDRTPYVGRVVDGYIQHGFSLSPGQDIIFNAYAHCLVYLWLYGPYNPQFVIDHIDRNRNNNCSSNLRCVTESVNTQHTSDRKPWTAHPGHNQRKLPKSVHKELYELCFITGLSYTQIAEQTGISRQTVSRLIKSYQQNLASGPNSKSFHVLSHFKLV